CFHAGKVVAFAASRAHWVDIGGMRQGFGSVETTEIYQEGLQLRSLKIYDTGKRNDTLWQVIHDNLRFSRGRFGRSARAGRLLPTRRAPFRRARHALWAQYDRGLHSGDLGRDRPRGARLRREDSGWNLRGGKLSRQ